MRFINNEGGEYAKYIVDRPVFHFSVVTSATYGNEAYK